MRLAVTIGIRHGATTPVVLTGPHVPYQAQRDAFKDVRASKENAEFERVTLYELDAGNGRSMRFKPVAVNAPKDPKADDKSKADNADKAETANKSKPAQSKKS